MGYILKLDKPGRIGDNRKFFFSHWVVERWNSLDQKTVDYYRVSAFKED